ncbi:hypothetical protein BXY85_3189 [Roseivirga pacifica]|uniref:Uncharacterized protein n=1 Tax=Roseivirga pacifica TaxID=1267423 RepID=A0A1I0QT58_9BACT|nr:hypothetical protein BXY85_3189 [Roseivirga pacifica]SEW30801.1 hypothetical protein SAMN05216290_2686 [Roseivirga pacifica]
MFSFYKSGNDYETNQDLTQGLTSGETSFNANA